MISDGRRASQVVARLRALVRKSEPRQTNLSMNEIVDDVLLLVERELVKQRITLQLELEPSPPTILGDRVQLQQVIINLVMNAIQAMSGVADQPRVLSISSRSQAPATKDRSTTLEVRDTGVGIDPSSMAQLFTAFHTTKANGMGMGLSICRSIVDAHGGRGRDEPGTRCLFRCPSSGHAGGAVVKQALAGHGDIPMSGRTSAMPAAAGHCVSAATRRMVPAHPFPPIKRAVYLKVLKCMTIKYLRTIV
jgi:signal transduction histidine kinase